MTVFILKLGNVLRREPQKERGDSLFPRCVLVGGMQETINAD